MNELDDLAWKYGSDKTPRIMHFYTEYYDTILKDKKYSIKKVLELGIGSKELMPQCPHYVVGASLRMWRDYFPNAQVYGADILPELMFKDERIETILCDQSKKESLESLIKKTGNDIDLFIDDGSHRPGHQILTCLTLMPLLKKDVIYIIEDVGNLDIIPYFKDYDCHIVRKSRLHNRYNRLLEVKRKK